MPASTANHLIPQQKGQEIRSAGFDSSNEPDGTATFRSILFDGDGDAASAVNQSAPEYLRDLNLDQIVESITVGRDEYELKPFFHAPLATIDAIHYRQAVFRDLEAPALFDQIQLFAGAIRQMRSCVATAEKSYYKYQKNALFLSAVEVYCAAVSRLTRELLSASPQSLAIQGLRDYPRLRVELASKFSMELIDDLLAGLIDLTIANEPPESPALTCVQIAELPFYIAMTRREELARYPSVSLDQMAGRHWILFDRKMHPTLYDAIIHAAAQRGIRPLSIQHVTAPEEAFPFVADGSAIAVVLKTGALLLARNGVTVRPLNEPNLKVRTCLVCRADDDSKIASEFVRAYMRNVPDKKKHRQLPLLISA